MGYFFPITNGLTPQNCLTKSEIQQSSGSIVEGNDGVVRVYLPSGPVVLTKNCCTKLSPSYTFDINKQECKWIADPKIEDSFKVNLNANGNDGTLFLVENESDKCNLRIEFDYLFNISCENLRDVLNNSFTSFQQKTLSELILDTENQITLKEIECSSLTNQINTLTSQYNNTSYSVVCFETTGTIGNTQNDTLTNTGINDFTPNLANDTQNNVLTNTGINDFTPNLASTTQNNFTNTGFNNYTQNLSSNTNFFTNTQNNLNTGSSYVTVFAPFSFPVINLKTYCLTENGLIQWRLILGNFKYLDFINGVDSVYGCEQVNQLLNLEQTPGEYLYLCSTPFGTKTNLGRQISNLYNTRVNCNNELNILIQKLETYKSQYIGSPCKNPVDVLEKLDVSLNIDVVENGRTTTISTLPLHNAIGVGNLYNYLQNNDSPIYICGKPTYQELLVKDYVGCVPFLFNTTDNNNSDNVISCNNLINTIKNTLFIESNLSGTTNGVQIFNESLNQMIFTPKWVSYSHLISDTTLINKIKNKKIQLSFKINDLCSDFCIMLDNVKLNKECEFIDRDDIFVTKSPSFNLIKIPDNKKSWVNNSTKTNRNYSLINKDNTIPYRLTDYSVDDERLIINTKEMNLDINSASAIENDVWYFINDNPSILTGVTNCNSCYSGCCGDNLISFDQLLNNDLNKIKTLEDFKNIIISELTDVKNRKTISSYPTIRALYDRYLDSLKYCGILSSEFNYYSIDEFSGLIDSYWVEIIEQVIPSTTIWGSVKIYSNTIFDQNKFQYKKYTTSFCDNIFSGYTLPNPINGISGITITSSVEQRVITSDIYNTSKCDKISINQMSSGSEFIGKITIM